MGMLFNLIYLIALAVLSPWLIYKALTTGKYRRGMWSKLTGRAVERDGQRRCVWFHGVSVGEVHLLTEVVAAFRRRHPGWECVVSTTTDTGFAEAKKRFGDLAVFLWPLDFSWSVGRALRRVRPTVVVLAESEIWPNFIRMAKSRGVKLALLNARMSPRSMRRYEKLRWLTRSLICRFDLIAAQDEDYAEAFRQLGATRVEATGSVKFDGIQFDRGNGRTAEMRRLLGLGQDAVVWVAGSTQAPEEEVVVDIFREARRRHPELCLIIVPRQRERFAEVSEMLERSGLQFLRRSDMGVVGGQGESGPQVFLVDTIGELRAVWGLADVAFVGGSLDGRRGGQNMIEPAAYGAAVVFGPHVWNFKQTARQLVEHDAAVQVDDGEQLREEILRLLGDEAARVRLGRSAQEFVVSQQGATERTLAALDSLLGAAGGEPKAA